MVGRGLGGDRQARRPWPRRTSSTEPAVDRCRKWTRRAGEPGQGDVAGDHQLLGLGRHAGDAEAARPLALVHVAAGGQAVVLAVLGQRDAEGRARTPGPGA